MLEKSDMIWKSYMFNLKKGTLKFLLNSCLDTLPTQTNLLQWGKSASDLCKLCLQASAELQGRRQETTKNILNGCTHWTKMTARFKVVALKPNIFVYLHTYRMFKKIFLKSALGVKSKF